jgi:hypothetical protein
MAAILAAASALRHEAQSPASAPAELDAAIDENFRGIFGSK